MVDYNIVWGVNLSYHLPYFRKPSFQKKKCPESVCNNPGSMRESAPQNIPRRRPGGRFPRWLVTEGYLVDPASSICLSQRLSHASHTQLVQRNCEWLIKSVMVPLIALTVTWITVAILELITVAPPHGPIVEKRTLKCPLGSQNAC